LRILILSDIHANLQALEASLEAAPAYDLAVNLGDVVGYGASPDEVVKASRSLGNIFVRGNHDKAASGISDARDFNPIAAAAIRWTGENLSAENLAWLKALPQGPLPVEGETGIQLVHGSPRDEDEYLMYEQDAHAILAGIQVPATFFGHTHVQGAFAGNEGPTRFISPRYKDARKIETFEFELQTDKKYLINPGSVGQPRDGDWRAAFLVFDSTSRMATFYRVPYDVKSAQQSILAAKLPERLAIRLGEGR
jgi:predicted phosphodiesterase